MYVHCLTLQGSYKSVRNAIFNGNGECHYFVDVFESNCRRRLADSQQNKEAVETHGTLILKARKNRILENYVL